MMIQTWDDITEKYVEGKGKPGNCRGNDNWFFTQYME